jgi:hypothetical protein
MNNFSTVHANFAQISSIGAAWRSKFKFTEFKKSADRQKSFEGLAMYGHEVLMSLQT